MLAALPRYFEVIDSSRGVVITVPTDDASSELARAYYSAVAAAVRRHKGLHLNVEAHGEAPDSLAETERHARSVRDALVTAGISPDIIVARGYGNTRPRGPSETPSGRAKNRRIEIVIAGDPIGTLATWDRSYTLQPQRR
jgi:hypothetical protein